MREMDNAIAFIVRFIFLESVLKIRFLHAYPTCRMREERWRIEDLLERLEAAELLIAFATVCRKVYSRYTAQVFNYGLTDRLGPRFRMIIRLPLFPVYFRRVLQYVYANYGRRWNRVGNGIIFRVTFEQMSSEHAPTLSR